jgi:hypothetical protein
MRGRYVAVGQSTMRMFWLEAPRVPGKSRMMKC